MPLDELQLGVSCFSPQEVCILLSCIVLSFHGQEVHYKLSLFFYLLSGLLDVCNLSYQKACTVQACKVTSDAFVPAAVRVLSTRPISGLRGYAYKAVLTLKG